MNPTPSATPPPRPRTRVRTHVLRVLVLLVALAGLLVAAGYAFLSTQMGVQFATEELTVRTGGRLRFEGVTGSLLEAVRVRRLVWQGPEASVTATDVTLRWSPLALWSRGVVVQALGAERVELDVKPSNAAATAPTTLALPFEVSIEKLAIAQLEWHVGPRAGTIRGLGLKYRGGAAAHSFENLSLAAENGTLAGDVSIGAVAPFPITGHLALTAETTMKAAAELELSGALAALTVDGKGTAGDARIAAHVELAPLATVPLVRLTVEASELDLAAWHKAMPPTRLAVTVEAQPTGDGFTGTFRARNALTGPVDSGRVPVRALSARFAWHTDAMQLDDLVAELAGGGSATGKARIPLVETGSAGTWSLAVRDVDLRQIYSPLIATRLRGTIAADLDAKRQRVSGDVSDAAIVGGVALAFAAIVSDGTIDVERFRATVRTSDLQGKGSLRLRGDRAFAIDATAQHVDPSRFGDFPAGDINGKVSANGVLAPSWRVAADVTVAQGSRFAGVPFSGTATGTVTRDSVRDANIAVQVSSAKLVATGSTGQGSDTVTATLDAPRLADLVPFLPEAVPRTLQGALKAKGELRGPPTEGTVTIDATGTGLKLTPELSAGSAVLHFTLAAAPGAGLDFTTRRVELDVDAKNLVAPPGTFATAQASVKGTLGAHAISVAVAGDDIGVNAAARGALRLPSGRDAAAGYAWSGTLDTLEGRGPLALRLTAPTTLAFARGRVGIGEARLAVADGNMRIDDLAWDNGRITTHGSFAAFPLTTAARIAGTPLPFDSTVTLGGDWSLAASPRLNGTINIRREGGDLRVKRDASLDLASVPMGITSFVLAARFVDDSVDAKADLVSTRAGSVTAKLAIGAIAGAPLGKIAPNSPLDLAVTATLPTLQLLQPWIGTLAVVDGRATADVTARGTVAKSVLAGSLRAEGLRLDAPQYGVHWSDGLVAAHFADGRVVVDRLTLTAGTGKFTASGTVGSLAPGDARTDARIAWHAEDFRIFNRPDLHLVVDGDGTLAFENGKLTLSGKLKADEGRFVYVSDPSATLGSDVVVKGWTKPAPPLLRASDLPLTLDLAVDLGDKLFFSGEGLETRLEGTLRIANGPRGFSGKGTIQAVNGTYFAFGKRLTIDPGRLLFDGPLDNPALDIVALRKNLAVEAGVKVTGTVKVPIITLTSNPPVPDGEKLSWLVLGQGLERTSGTDLAALQAASAVLLGRNSKSMTSRIAESVGLDDISIKGSAAGKGGTSAESQVLALSKRISDKLSLVYEQGLSIANNAVKIEYSLTRNISLQAEMGVVSGVGIRYNISFE